MSEEVEDPTSEAPPCEPDAAPLVSVWERDKLEATRSRELMWALGSFAVAYVFIIWASLNSPLYLLLALLAVPFLPYRWWGILVLVISAVLIFSLCNWSHVQTGMRLYRDAREGHWI